MDKTQEQLSSEVLQSRESLSKQENGNRSVQPGLTRQFIDKYNDPWLALEAANEYIGWGVTKLDGPKADNLSSIVQSEVEEALHGVLDSIARVEINKVPNFVHSMDLQDIRISASEIVEAVYWSLMYLAIVCETYNMGWLELWEEHYSKLKSNGYVL
ncbi:XRE family transcriptional regulator [Halobacillus sp. Marseille-Q1614]|uniref:XRE family transcriptional regulator n=1 Tax=Halobacillus sp. Marseille-Q1614 TaxID=2709134 RepID=UPI0020C277DA|nr:XRE family transcriptional regulator [Halobacillus sp. Marseille-Q1614]